MVALAATAGCGAIQNGSEQRVRISTVPPGARLLVDGRRVTSPAVVSLARDRDHVVEISMEGFTDATAHLASRRDGAVTLGNCLLLFCIPEIWESAAPAHYRLVPEEVDVTLNPTGWSPR